MKKKILALLLTTAMAATSIVGCSSSGSADTAGSGDTTAAPAAETSEAAPAETTTDAKADTTTTSSGEDMKLTVAWWGNQVRNDRTQQILDMYTAAHPNVTFDSQPATFADFFTKISTSVASQTVPDVLQMNYSSYIEQYVDSGALLDLTPYVDSGALDVSTIDQAILDSGSVDGKLYCVCAGVNVPSLIYNKTLLDELGIEIKDNMTIDEFEAVCKEVYEKSGVKTDFAYGNAESMLTYIMRGEGIEDIYAGDKFSVEDEKAFAPYFKIYQDGLEQGWMIDAGVYAELTLNSVEQCPLVYYSSPETQSWCACYWSNQLTAMKGAAPEGVELDFTTWPAADPKKANYLHPSMYFSCGANTAYPDEAVAVLNYIINDIDANNVLLAERGIPAPKAVADAISPNLTEENQKEIHLINDVVSPNSSKITPPAPSKASEVHNLANELTEQVLYGQMTAEEASAKLFTDGNVMLAQ